MMRTILVTGGIGSGKSAVCAYLSEKGIPVYDTDSQAKRLYVRDSELVDRIERYFGIRLFTEEGKLDKKQLSRLVFSDKKNLDALESIVHPAVLKDFLAWKERKQKEGAPFVCMESAIVLDKPIFQEVYDQVWVVDAPVGLRLERAVERDQVSKEKIMERIRQQQIHLEKADYVIMNDGSLETLRERVDNAIEILNL